MTADLIHVLRQLPRFSALSETDLSGFARSLALEERPDGHVFMREGERARGCYLILSGTVSVTRNRPPYIDEVTRLGPGDLFGIVSLVDDEPRAATCRASGPVRVASLEGGALKWLMAEHTPVALAVQRMVADQLAKDFRAVAAHVRAALEERAKR